MASGTIVLKKLFLILYFLVIIGKTSAQTTIALFDVGNEHLLYNRFDEALATFEQARKQSEEVGNWEMVSSCLNKISEIQLELFHIDEARQNALEALEISQEHLTQEHIERANALNNLGNSHFQRGQHEKALGYYNEAMELTAKIDESSGEKHLYAAPTNMGIGNVYFGQLEYEKAFEHFEHALEVNKEILGKNHPYVANSYLSLANLHRNRGSYKLARENYDNALEIFEQFFGKDHPSIGATFIGIADIYNSSGAYEQALQYYNRGYNIFLNYFDESINPKFGDIYLGFADIAKNQGDYPSALNYYQRAVKLYASSVGENHQNTVRGYLGIGNTYLYQEKVLEALENYGKVLDINFFLVGENHSNTSAAYNNLGSLYYFSGDFELSETYFNKALKIDKTIHGEKHPNVANAYYNLARIFGEQGGTKKALDYIQSAISASIQGFDDSNIFVNPALLNFFDSRDLLWYLSFKGELLEQGFTASGNMKGLDISIHSFVQSDSLVDQIRKSYIDRRDELALADLTGAIYGSAVNGCFSALEIITPENVKQIGSDVDFDEKVKEYQNRIFYFQEKKKAAVLFSSLAEANAKTFGGVPNELIERDTRLKKDINRFTQALTYTRDSLKLRQLQDSLFFSNRAYEELQKNMEENFPRYYELKYDVGVVELEKFKKFIPDGTMVVSYFEHEGKLFSTRITRSSFEISKSKYPRKISKTIEIFRRAIKYSVRKKSDELGKQLYTTLLPFEIPEGIQSLHFIPEGVMADLPFDALIMPDNTFLGLKYQISNSYSGNLLYKTFNRPPEQSIKTPHGIVAFAPVEFRTNYSAIINEVKNKSYEENGVPQSFRNMVKFLPTPDLPGSKHEVENVATSLDKLELKNLALFSELATESTLKSDLIRNYKYLHIASHGMVNEEEPEFSGLLLSPDSTDQDGILFSGEIYGLTVNAALASLSACETGLGKLSHGEGIIGISRALIYAGAKNIIVSLWKVGDEPTQLLMSRFYEEVAKLEATNEYSKDLTYAEALHKAKKYLATETNFKDPVDWAPFILIGL